MVKHGVGNRGVCRFWDLQESYDWADREVKWLELGMYDVGVKLIIKQF